MPDLTGVLLHFCFDGEFNGVEPLVCGNINDTYIASYRNSSGAIDRYILQRINHFVFKDPVNLMKNVIAITDHIREKIIRQGGNPLRETLKFIPVTDGGYIYKCDHGNFWRAYIYIDNACTYQIVEKPEHFLNAGRAFGKFQKLLIDFPAEELYFTIPDYHNTPKRYRDFLEVVEKDSVNRVKDAEPEIKFVKSRARFLSILADGIEAGEILLRVTHNDTKFNNVLIDDRTGEGICVIDLDTVMLGSSLIDFGDSIRSGTNKAGEEELDLFKVEMDLELFEQFTRGFLEYTSDFLTPAEIEFLPYSGILIAIELGMRFLMDYLNGDVYFKISRENQNLHRARVQFRLAEDMESKLDEMKHIIEKSICISASMHYTYEEAVATEEP